MQYTITAGQMRNAEQTYMSQTGVTSAVLMERASQGIVETLKRRGFKSVLFLCGNGNNGGDGYAAARLWQRSGGQGQIWAVGCPQPGTAADNRETALGLGIPSVDICITDELPSVPPVDCIVDALFGIGLNRPLSDDYLRLINHINAAGIPVIAVDIPSGLDSDSGHIFGDAIRADETVTFHRIKRGLILHESVEYTGKTTVWDIGLDNTVQQENTLTAALPEDLQSFIPPRPRSGHKGTFGKVVILAGNTGMCGAAAMAAEACITSGAGLTYLLCREHLVPILQVLCPAAVCIPLPERDGVFTEEAQLIAARASASADCCVIGCGLGNDADLLPVLQAVKSSHCPKVWDASVLDFIAADSVLGHMTTQDIITPHPGEAGRMLNLSAADINRDMPSAARQLHDRFGCSVLLKGARTVMTDGTDMAVNITGTPAMAKGGSGDILSGIIGALLARKDAMLSPLQAMQAAALIHGMAGIRAEALYGQHCVTPKRMLDQIRLDAQLLPE